MDIHFNPTLEAAVTSTAAAPLSAINVGIINDQGFVVQVITLEELARTGNRQDFHMSNYAQFGEVEYEFTISDADNLSGKVAYLREQMKQAGRCQD
jgi:hypothetical protein